MIIREVMISDAERIAEIYKYYVENTAISFEYEPPTKEEFECRIAETTKTHPYLVAEQDGRVVGYCYATQLKRRQAYFRSVETSLYVDKDLQKHGIGKALYNELEKRLKEKGITHAYACITYVDPPDEYQDNGSVAYHFKVGYKPVGHFHGCGEKFGRNYDVVWMEKQL